MSDPEPAEACNTFEHPHSQQKFFPYPNQILQRPLLNPCVNAWCDLAVRPSIFSVADLRTVPFFQPSPQKNHATARIHFGGPQKVFPTLAKLLSAIWAIFKVNGNTTKDKEIITIWVQHLQTGLGIFARLLIWKNQTCETDSLCFFPLFFSVFLECSPANHLAGSPAALIGPHTRTSSCSFFGLFLKEQSAAALCTAAGSLSESRAAGVTPQPHCAVCLSV